MLTAMKQFDIHGVGAALSRLRGIHANAFGSEAHGFEMNPVLSESEAATFERSHDVVLPYDYRQFLTELGNGGAGPFYGIFPLGFMDDNFDLRSWEENKGIVGTPSKPFLFQTEWNNLSGYPDVDLMKRNVEEYDRQIERFDERYWSSELMKRRGPDLSRRLCVENLARCDWGAIGKAVGGQTQRMCRTPAAAASRRFAGDVLRMVQRMVGPVLCSGWTAQVAIDLI